MITVTGFVIGLLLLVVLNGLPFWLYSALISLVYALIVPLAAVGHTLLYGDAAAEQAEHSERADAEDREASTVETGRW
jgi:hypothetical protein